MDYVKEFPVTGQYLNLPVKTGAYKCLVSLKSSGKKVREFEIELAESEPDKEESGILLSNAIYSQSIQDLREGKKLHNKLLDEANNILNDILDREPGHPMASKLLIATSLLRQDGPLALKAWHYYFNIPLQQVLMDY